MTDAPAIRHALLTGDVERRAVLDGSLDLTRQRSTAIRGFIALADQTSGRVTAMAHLDSVDPVAGRLPGGAAPSEYTWRLSRIVALEQPFHLGTACFGPVWARLGSSDRIRVAGGKIPDEDVVTEVLDQNALASLGREVDLREATLSDSDQSTRVYEHRVELAPFQLIDSDVETRGEPDAPGDPLEARPEVATPTLGQAQDSAEDSAGNVLAESLLEETVEAAVQSQGLAPTEPPFAVERPLPVDIEAARRRAMSFVPADNLTESAARRLLIDLRETEIKSTFPEVRPGAGVLRKTMLDRLIDEAVETVEDYRRLIPRDVQQATDRDQVAAYLEPIVQILARIR